MMTRSVLFLLMVFALNACKKSYTCACGDMNSTERTPVWETTDTKKNAEAQCGNQAKNASAITNYTCGIQ